MKTGFIGAGKVGFSLGKYLAVNNKELSGYYSKNGASSKEAAEFTNSKCYLSLEHLINESSMIFITVPDDEIKQVWQEIRKINFKDKFICHCSGSLSSNIFSNINSFNSYGYSVHPMYAFSDKYNSYKNLQSAYFTIEGNEDNISEIKQYFESLGNKVLILHEEKKSLYHFANVAVSNLVLSLLNIGTESLISCGVEKEQALAALMPLIENNIKNIKEKGFTGALTGPVERMDLNTLKHHIAAIPREQLEVYKLLSLDLAELSEEKHKDRDYSPIKEYLMEL